MGLGNFVLGPGFGTRIAAVTPNNDNDLANHGFIVSSVDGEVNVIASGDTDPQTIPVKAGIPVPCVIRRVRVTGTSIGSGYIRLYYQ